MTDDSSTSHCDGVTALMWLPTSHMIVVRGVLDAVAIRSIRSAGAWAAK